MAYDEALAARIRELMNGEPNLSEQKMFGGLAFLVGGNMAIAASGQGGVLFTSSGQKVRMGREESDELLATTNADEFEMRGRVMAGWLRVAPKHLGTVTELAKWVELGAAYARSLPPSSHFYGSDAVSSGGATCAVSEASSRSRRENRPAWIIR